MNSALAGLLSKGNLARFLITDTFVKNNVTVIIDGSALVFYTFSF